MTKRQPPARPTAAEQSRRFYADPTMRIAAEAARQNWNGATPVIAPVRASRQVHAVRAGRPVQPLPTRAARRIKRRARRAELRALNGLAVMGVTLLVLIFLIPVTAAVTAAVTLGAMTIAWTR